MKALVKNYELRIQKATKENDIKDLMIGISKDCSSYKLSWEAFMNLRKMIQTKGKQLGVAWGQR